MNAGWAVFIEDRINDLLVLLERIAIALERVADASEAAVEEEDVRQGSQ
jgi:hypothetical protein